MDNQLISVGIITRDRAALLDACLNSLLNQKVTPRSIILVSSPPFEKTRLIVRKYKDTLNIKYIEHVAIGISSARNKILDTCKTKLLAFIDDDCIADSNWLMEMIKCYQKNPEVVLIQGQCRIFPYHGVTAYIYQDEYNKWLQNNRSDNGYLLKANVENALLNLQGINKQIRFDENNGSYYGEDIDFSYQILLNKGKILYNPKAIVHIQSKKVINLLYRRFSKGYASALLDLKWKKHENKFGISLRGKTFLKNNSTQVFKKLPNYNHKLDVLCKALYWLYNEIYRFSYSSTLLIKTKFNGMGDASIPLSKTKQKTIKSSAVFVVIVKNNNSLKTTLPYILNQSVPPLKYIFILIRNDIFSITEISKINKYINYDVYKVDQIDWDQTIVPIISKYKQIICIITSDMKPLNNWLETVIETFKYNPQSEFVQGSYLYEKKMIQINLVRQFIWQTHIKYSLINREKNYSKFLNGTKINYQLNNLILGNFAAREGSLLPMLRQMARSSSIGKLIVWQPQAEVVDTKSSFKSIIEQGFDEGRQIVDLKSSPLYGVIYRIAAFSYFLLRRQAWMQIPLLLPLYILYLISFYIGIVGDIIQRKK